MSRPAPPLDDVLGFIGRQTGLALDGRRAGLEVGIRRAMARAGVADPGAYLGKLVADEAALDDLLGELTVGETYFFREPGQFAFLRRVVLPEFRRLGRTPRTWSAGCASGEEAYSLAMLFAQEGFGMDCPILATDLCPSALERARRGVYRAWSLRGAAGLLARPYLEAEGASYRVTEALRRAVVFRPLNLAQGDYPSARTGTAALDLILCRNVLIYLDRETVRRVARRLFEALTPGGWLLTASSDPPLGELAPFEMVVAPEGVFCRRPALDFAAPAVPVAEFALPPAAVSAWDWLADVPEAAEPEPEPEPTPAPAPSVAAPVLPAGQRVRPDNLAEARAALARGEYARVLELTEGGDDDAARAAVRVRALAGRGTREAERACVAATAQHPLAAELAYLHGLLLLDLGRDAEAAQALRRVLYLDGTLALVHFTLGSTLERLGDAAGAARAYRNARALCEARPPDEAVPFGEGGQAGQLAEASAAHLARLDVPSGRPS